MTVLSTFRGLDSGFKVCLLLILAIESDHGQRITAP